MTAYVKIWVYAYSVRRYIYLITTTDVVLIATANLFTTYRPTLWNSTLFGVKTDQDFTIFRDIFSPTCVCRQYLHFWRAISFLYV